MVLQRKILLVDDDADIVEMLASTLDHAYEVITATDGLIAWDIFQKEKPFAVVTDLRMPVLNGIELIKKIRLIDKTAIVAISGVDKSMLDYAVTIGADVIIEKPFNAKTIVETLEDLEIK